MVSPVKTEWWFDMEEEYNDGIVVEFSFGPLQYNYDSVISVQQFVDDINNLFENTYRAANNPGEAYPLYYIYAKTLGGYYNDNRTKNNFNLRYYIQAVFHEGQDVVYGGLNTFKIKFKTGPHGFEVADLQNAGIVPRGVATIKSDLDARAAVIPYSSHISTILDNPPVPPDFRIVPYSGVKQKMFLFQNVIDF